MGLGDKGHGDTGPERSCWTLAEEMVQQAELRILPETVPEDPAENGVPQAHG